MVTKRESKAAMSLHYVYNSKAEEGTMGLVLAKSVCVCSRGRVSANQVNELEQ